MMTEQSQLDASSLVIEIASNDGALLQHFSERGIPVLGVEPAANVAAVAKAKGIPTEVAFFGRDTAQRLAAQHKFADLMVANNVLAHVPDLNDFVAGFKILLKPKGTATFEFSHLANLILQRQFDTIYHEHFSYFSLSIVDRIFAHHGLYVFDVDVLPTHGGSLRVHVAHAEAGRARTHRVGETIAAEHLAGLDRFECYREFAESIVDIKCALLEFLTEARRSRKLVVGYGAPAKGNTLLNYCGIRSDLIPYTVDRNVHKQGRYLPGVHIPVVAPERILESKPDFVLILPWNLTDEITEQMAAIREWGGRFVVAIPSLRILP
jgi:SAM-dependent methyltransferase